MQPKKEPVKLYQLFYSDGTTFVPSDREQEVVSQTLQLFRDSQNQRDRSFSYFDGLSLIDYINDSVLRFNTNVDERDDIEDWQAAVNDPFTRNKVLAIHGKIMEVLPIASFTGRGDEDAQKGILLSNLYEYVEELDDYEELMSHILLEAIVKGTAIGYEDIEYCEKKYRDVEGVGDSITVTETVDKTTKLYGSLVPLEEFYPASVSIRRMSDQPYAFWRKVLPYARFLTLFGHYRKSDLVGPKQSYLDTEARPYYMDFIDGTVPDGSVELIRMYDKINDEYIIMANGIWLNPLSIEGGEVVSPLPWNHKELPFFEIKFDLFGDFFYGKSLPDRLKAMQDVLNVLTNMLLDQSFLTIFPPLLTNGFDDIEDDYLRPGRRTPVDTQGLPIDQAFHVLQNPTPTGWHQYILEYTRRVMEESSIDKVSQGVAGAGDRTTAQEIRMAASGVAAMLQQFARMVNYGIKRKAYLKASNILQFGMNSEAPILRQVMGEGSAEEAKKAFAVIKLDNTVITSGKRGTKVIELYKDKSDLPSKSQVKARAVLSKASSGKEIEIVAIPPTYLRNFLFDVKIIPNIKNEQTKEVEKALQIEKARLYGELFPDLIDRQELAAQTMEKFGDDPAKMLNPDVLNPQPQLPPEGMTGGQQGMNSPNMMRSMGGGAGQGMQELSSLMQ